MKTHTNSDVIVRISFSRVPDLSEWDPDDKLWNKGSDYDNSTFLYLKTHANLFITDFNKKLKWISDSLIAVPASPNAHSDQTLLGDINAMFSHLPILSDEFDDKTRTQQRIFFSETSSLDPSSIVKK